MLYFTKIGEINISFTSWLLQIFLMSIILFANCWISISLLKLMLFDPICVATIFGLSFFHDREKYNGADLERLLHRKILHKF